MGVEAPLTRAKLCRNGGSQAVRLPKDCRFEGDEVLIRRDGRRVVLEPVDAWPEAFLAALGAWTETIEKPRIEPLTLTREPFGGS